MKTTYIVIAVVILVLLAAGGYYMPTQSTKPSPTAQMTNNKAPELDQDEDDMPTAASSSTPTAMEQLEASAGSTPADTEIVINGSNFKFEPSTIKVKQGEKVKITFKNVEGFHDFVIDGMPVKTAQIQAGNEATVQFTPDKKGTFEFYCSVGKHRQMGMKGTLAVE